MGSKAGVFLRNRREKYDLNSGHEWLKNKGAEQEKEKKKWQSKVPDGWSGKNVPLNIFSRGGVSSIDAQ